DENVVERRIRADGDGRRIADTRVVVVEPTGIHAVGGYERVDGLGEIGRRESELTSALVPVHDLAAHVDRTTEHLCSRGHIALGEKIPDPARRDTALRSLYVHVVDDIDREAVCRSEFAQQFGRACAAMPEAEVLS